MGQSVIYYAISEEHSVSHELYRESIKKTWYSPVELNARVHWDNPTVESTGFTLDSKYSLEVYFHDAELVDRNVEPTEGDYIEYGSVVFEITSVTRPQIVFGQANKKILVKCVCVPSREGQMKIHSRDDQFIDNTHPVQPKEC